jgi:hypothetical protein
MRNENRLDPVALDRHITGNYGEDQYKDSEICDDCPFCDNEDGHCERDATPSDCKAEQKQQYLEEQAERRREDLMCGDG